jgi:hypothetical protein
MVEIKRELKLKMWHDKIKLFIPTQSEDGALTAAPNDVRKGNELVAEEDLDLVECDVLKIAIPAFVSSDMLKM